MTNAPVLANYDPAKELTIKNDASQHGIGSALIQEAKPIAYASQTLSDAEQKYAQKEKEMLAVVWGLDKFRRYTYGRDRWTDHKLLNSIVLNPLSKAPERLESLFLPAQECSYSLTSWTLPFLWAIITKIHVQS